MSAPHNAATIADYVENARKAVAEGYDCIKIDFFTFAPEDGHRYTERIGPACCRRKRST